MDRLTKREKEYKEVIEQQKDQISRYEKKLRDVVQAYKGIQKEKEALESSLKALAEAKSSSAEGEATRDDELEHNADQGAVLQETRNELELAEISSKEKDIIKRLKAQLGTLSDSLATITAEKSRCEANFQQDRKRILLEKEVLEKSVAAAYSQAEMTSHSFKQQLLELKSNLSVEKSERSRESINNQVILRELQKTIAEERQKRESLELELNSKSRLSHQANNLSSNQLEVAERKLRDLSNELESTKMKLFTAEQKLQEPSSHLVQLQNEMADLKIQHRLAIQQEQRNAIEAKEDARQLAEAHEKRVATLETRLAEFSERIGSYDRLRQQDLATVTKLKEQLNTMQNMSSPLSHPSEEDYDIEKLIGKIKSLKNRLLDVSRRSNATVNLTAIFELDNIDSNSEHDEACQLELQQLRKELEWYKREENQSNPKSVSLSAPAEEEVNQMRVQIQFLRNEMEHNEQEHKHSLRSMQESCLKERTEWKDELTQMERSCRTRIADMEQQLQKQRERSLTLLQEKDEELVSLRELLNMKNLSTLSLPPATVTSEVTDSNEEWPESLAPLASLRLGASASGGQMLHYVEELARKEGEIQGLRKSKNQLEASLREMQMAFVTMEHKMAEQKQHLHEELARLERNQSRESANLEYLKNVLLEFFLHSDPSSQSHMFNAIAACLHFSPKEIQRVRSQHPKWKLNVGQTNPAAPFNPTNSY
ncbi:GRIP and coiled-coil domain-containing protein 1-like [Daphnia carinata]|uniref:GRIP and coiled-coil domain-containing protein 1-like n=1 Tax=Daphnia carinata TaxID=120202 RepID=UPI00257A8577|nr:GRIP and coiled-coil domain-containing protein 1-like [Daphnia carinata]